MRIVLLLAGLLSLAGCAQNPVSGGQDFVMMSEQQEVVEGRRADQQVRQQYKVYPSKALQDYVNYVGQKLAKHSHRPNLEYHFTVVDSPEINAFALPGGYVYITRGILPYLNSEAEMAAVLGHEIGHVTARHGVRQQSAAQATNIGMAVASIFVPQLNTYAGNNLANLLGGALLSGYGREHELEADKLGAEYLARTGYDPHAMISVVGVLKNQELFDAEQAKLEGREPRRYHGVFATHPDADTRLQQVVGESSKLEVSEPLENRSEYLKQIDGIVFAESSDQGVLRNNKFLHRELGFALTFPTGWKVQNLPVKLVATSPDGSGVIQLKVDPKPNASPFEYASRLGGSSARVESADFGGLPAAILNLNAGVTGTVALKGQMYVIQCNAKSAEVMASLRDDMLRSVRSFHPLSESERKEAQPLSVDVVTAHAGDTYAGLAKASPLAKNAESYLRLINAAYPKGEPVAGQQIKIIK